ncbi:metal-dependent hydrolase [Aquimarina sp. ERC-38]|uniref:metal-dependent hydrolase n=1 Tax=Aquimarina sp. ERC-38 TaxID=2949996 RepID=UPI002245657B|nr:metal-dependent hydrolase [Aquimarina sp. ERC-38]UZO79928.1 metal-dependent hydrolase [Aquimarina sp. ERC-38]
MDSLTQIVLGAAVGEAVLGKKVGNKALLWGAIAGTIPDLDVLTKFLVDDVTANELHRGFSHSIIFCLLFAPVFGWSVAKIYKRQEATWWDWTQFMFWGLFTHPLLDAFTTWGTQLFWPFEYRIAFNSIFVVDPLYTLPFLGSVIALSFYKRNHPKRSQLNWLGISLSTTYLLSTLVIQFFATKQFKNELEKQGISYNAIQTRPTPFNTILWTANVKTEDSFLIGYYSFFDTRETISFTEFPKNYQLLQAVNNEPIVQRLKQLTNQWYAVERKDNTLYLNDLRFGVLGIKQKPPEFVFGYRFYKDDEILKAEEKERDMSEASGLLTSLWDRIWGN